MAKRKRRRKRKETFQRTIRFELIGILLIALAVISIAGMGAVGKAVVLFFRFFAGEWYMLFLIGLVLFGGYLIWKREIPPLYQQRLIGIYLITASVLLLTHIPLFELLVEEGTVEHPSVIKNTWELFWLEAQGEAGKTGLGGGMLGALFFALFYFLFDEAGAKIVSGAMIISGLILLTGKTFGDRMGKMFSAVSSFIKKQWQAFLTDMRDWKKKRAEMKQEKKLKQIEEDRMDGSREDEMGITGPEKTPDGEPIISSFTEKALEHSDDLMMAAVQEQEQEKENIVQDADEDAPPMTFAELENENYQLPPLSLLKQPSPADQSGEYELIQANAAKLERTFQSFGVKAKVTQVHLGPAVTKYEVHPDIGVKVSKIVSLSDDLALALAAKDIRIEAPIPGKSAIGIEVPNSEIALVSLREVLDATQNHKPNSKLMIALGRDITGDAVVAELNKMPHLLIAGSTGSGKSVCINAIILSILMRAKPHEVKMMMIDPKMVELSVYNGIPHLLAPVVTNAKKASQALQKVVNEMERRYELFSQTGTRNIEGYNDYIRKHHLEKGDEQPLLPYIVVIIDELADLMMVASSDVEASITRLAQMARAAGIHLIIATQRPSVDVITGVIKANIPSRIAFAVSSQTDSRTILDMGGAEKLLGRGDMLFLPVGASKPIRVQGAFVSDEEVEKVVDYVVSQQKAQYQEDMIPDDIPDSQGEVEDELFEEAVRLVIEMQTASVSMLQRRFRIGYTRAARLIDEMEARGIVGPYEGSKPRAVLISKPPEEASS